MTVIDTKKYLDQWFDQPITLLEKLLNRKDAQHFYRYLQFFGMYRPSKKAETDYMKLKELHAWELIEEYEQKYQSLWDGCKKNIYIFPLQSRRSFLLEDKSGVTFPDEMYFFLSPIEDHQKEWEALFVHEYHHINRLNKLKDTTDQWVLRDSLILEGLAELAVSEYCGEQYVSDYSMKYSKDQIHYFWEKYMKNHLHVKKSDPLHDDLLFGRKFYPKFMGYAIGYYVIKHMSEERKFHTIEKLSTPSSQFEIEQCF
ncbi:uncharacterized protein YjaZ [Oikeobacillus pervagus]|uniref:Uncharacterized protein YjaZ n=1 Tax=Oikeobacillus pervagus TaxID=1325931 RepID=A0AAJ1WJH0_9BACI|nr:DUF2268 domain-containing putative Zn-dependent protease [Oikeobacillus pervagus]MDQ0215670.1 uncharacterized protein YjaZ [Oikeobacillus pervagus]